MSYPINFHELESSFEGIWEKIMRQKRSNRTHHNLK